MMDYELLPILLNGVIGVIVFLAKRNIDKSFDELKDIKNDIRYLKDELQEHKDDDHLMALSIRSLEENKAEQVRILDRLEKTLDEIKRSGL